MDFRSLADLYPNEASLKNNNPAGISYFGNNAFTKAMTDAGIKWSAGTARPKAEGSKYVSFDSVEDGMRAYDLLWNTEKYKSLSVKDALNRWGTGSIGAKIDMNKRIAELSEDERKQLQVAQLAKESPGFLKELKKAGYISEKTTQKGLLESISDMILPKASADTGTEYSINIPGSINKNTTPVIDVSSEQGIRSFFDKNGFSEADAKAADYFRNKYGDDKITALRKVAEYRMKKMSSADGLGMKLEDKVKRYLEKNGGAQGDTSIGGVEGAGTQFVAPGKTAPVMQQDSGAVFDIDGKQMTRSDIVNELNNQLESLSLDKKAELLKKADKFFEDRGIPALDMNEKINLSLYSSRANAPKGKGGLGVLEDIPFVGQGLYGIRTGVAKALDLGGLAARSIGGDNKPADAPVLFLNGLLQTGMQTGNQTFGQILTAATEAVGMIPGIGDDVKGAINGVFESIARGGASALPDYSELKDIMSEATYASLKDTVGMLSTSLASRAASGAIGGARKGVQVNTTADTGFGGKLGSAVKGAVKGAITETGRGIRDIATFDDAIPGVVSAAKGGNLVVDRAPSMRIEELSKKLTTDEASAKIEQGKQMLKGQIGRITNKGNLVKAEDVDALVDNMTTLRKAARDAGVDIDEVLKSDTKDVLADFEGRIEEIPKALRAKIEKQLSGADLKITKEKLDSVINKSAGKEKLSAQEKAALSTVSSELKNKLFDEKGNVVGTLRDFDLALQKVGEMSSTAFKNGDKNIAELYTNIRNGLQEAMSSMSGGKNYKKYLQDYFSLSRVREFADAMLKKAGSDVRGKGFMDLVSPTQFGMGAFGLGSGSPVIASSVALMAMMNYAKQARKSPTNAILKLLDISKTKEDYGVLSTKEKGDLEFKNAEEARLRREIDAENAAFEKEVFNKADKNNNGKIEGGELEELNELFQKAAKEVKTELNAVKQENSIKSTKSTKKEVKAQPKAVKTETKPMDIDTKLANLTASYKSAKDAGVKKKILSEMERLRKLK